MIAITLGCTEVIPLLICAVRTGYSVRAQFDGLIFEMKSTVASVAAGGAVLWSAVDMGVVLQYGNLPKQHQMHSGITYYQWVEVLPWSTKALVLQVYYWRRALRRLDIWLRLADTGISVIAERRRS